MKGLLHELTRNLKSLPYAEVPDLPNYFASMATPPSLFLGILGTYSVLAVWTWCVCAPRSLQMNFGQKEVHDVCFLRPGL